MPSTRSSLAAALLAAIFAVAPAACVRAGKDTRAVEVPMGSWPAWQDLTPLLELAEAQVDAPTFAALERARELLHEGQALAADAALAEANRGAGRHWIAVARADLAALYFSTCIRGVAWRLPERLDETTVRAVDFDPATRIEPGDLSVEALLTNLDDAVEAGKHSPSLQTQALIARVRVAGFVASCPANDEVGRRAALVMNTDLATLAAEAHLTPDLAYLWAGVQMQAYSGAAARPFLLQALEGGFDDPAVTYLLAAIAYEQGELAEAEALASEAGERYGVLGNVDQQAQCAFLRGEVARAGRRWDAAGRHYRQAITWVPDHTAAMIGLAATELGRGDGIHAAELLSAQIHTLMRGDEELDEPAALAIIDVLESLVILANADTLEISQLTREALLLNIEQQQDPFRRGLRFFYAATLEVRLGDYDSARGHAATAALEFEDSWVNLPEKADPRIFLDRLAEAAG